MLLQCKLCSGLVYSVIYCPCWVRAGRRAHLNFRRLLSSLLWVSVPQKADMGQWTACHCRATTQTWWTCLRQGPEREVNVRRQREEEHVPSHSGNTVLNRYEASSTSIIHDRRVDVHWDIIFFPCYLIKNM